MFQACACFDTYATFSSSVLAYAILIVVFAKLHNIETALTYAKTLAHIEKLPKAIGFVLKAWTDVHKSDLSVVEIYATNQKYYVSKLFPMVQNDFQDIFKLFDNNTQPQKRKRKNL